MNQDREDFQKSQINDLVNEFKDFCHHPDNCLAQCEFIIRFFLEEAASKYKQITVLEERLQRLSLDLVLFKLSEEDTDNSQFSNKRQCSESPKEEVMVKAVGRMTNYVIMPLWWLLKKSHPLAQVHQKKEFNCRRDSNGL